MTRTDSGNGGSDRELIRRFPHLAPDDELLAWGRSLEEKVENFGESINIWTQAILKQTDLATQQNQLIVSQNLILQETGKTNAELGKTLPQLSEDFEQLKREFQLLKNTIEKQSAVSQDLIALIGIERTAPQITTLSSRIKNTSDEIQTLQVSENMRAITLNDQTETLEELTKDVSANRRSQRMTLIFLVLLGITQTFLLLSPIKNQLDLINRNINTGLRQLQRLENR